MTRETLYRSIDARQVPALLASPSQGNAEAVVIRGEVDELIAQLNAELASVRDNSEQADAADTAAWQSAIESLSSQLSLFRDRVTGQVAVGHLAVNLAEAQTYLQEIGRAHV